MKQIATAMAAALVLAVPAGADFVPIKRTLPKPSKVDLVSCAPRTDGIDGYFCAETANRPRAGRAKATILFVTKSDGTLFGVRQPVR